MLNVTQSNLSQYLLKLESSLGAQLFVRSKNQLLPTEAGTIYVQAAKATLYIQSAAEESIKLLTSSGSINFGVSSKWGVQVIVDILPEFKKLCPTITLRIHQQKYGKLQEMLSNGKLDIAIMATDDLSKLMLPNTLLRTEELVLVLPESHKYYTTISKGAAIHRTELSSSLRNMPFILSDSDSSLRKIEDTLFKELMYYPNVVCEINDDEAAFKMIPESECAAIGPIQYAQNLKGIKTYTFNPPLYRSDVIVKRDRLESSKYIETLEKLIVQHPLFAK